MPCNEELLYCEHLCTMRCHPFPHQDVVCYEPCTRPRDCGHPWYVSHILYQRLIDRPRAEILTLKSLIALSLATPLVAASVAMTRISSKKRLVKRMIKRMIKKLIRRLEKRLRKIRSYRFSKTQPLALNLSLVHLAPRKRIESLSSRNLFVPNAATQKSSSRSRPSSSTRKAVISKPIRKFSIPFKDWSQPRPASQPAQKR